MFTAEATDVKAVATGGGLPLALGWIFAPSDGAGAVLLVAGVRGE